MNDLSAILTPEYISVILLPALIAGIAVSLCASLLGGSLVLKRCSMIGDGLSHVGYGTLCIAVALGWAPMKVTIPVVVLAAYILLRLSENSRFGTMVSPALKRLNCEALLYPDNVVSTKVSMESMAVAISSRGTWTPEVLILTL